MSKPMFELAAEIVAAQAGATAMTPEEVAASIASVHETLSRLHATEMGETTVGTEQITIESADDPMAKLRNNPERSIRKHSVTCLECGAEYKILNKKHLISHGLTPAEYREKWGFGPRRALSAKALSEKRREVAKNTGLGRKMAEARKAKATKKAPAKGKATREAKAAAPEKTKTVLRKK
ncbi:MAG: MucR family transcriptional regulator [Desulfatibacillaceae bacterium]